MFQLYSDFKYTSIPTICEINFNNKKSILNGFSSIISNISYDFNNTSLFKVKILNKTNSFYAIFKKNNLYIVGIGLENFAYVTDDLNEVRYLSYPDDISLSKENIISTFDKIFFIIKKNSSSEIFKLFNETKNSELVRILTFCLAESSKNDLIRDSLIFALKLKTFDELKSDLNLFPSAIKQKFYSYNSFLIFILNWKNILAFKGVFTNKSLTLLEIRNFFTKASLVPKDFLNLKELGIFF